MALFRRNDESGPTPEALLRTRSQHPSGRGPRATRGETRLQPMLTPTDWSRIEDLLATGAASLRPAETDECLVSLERLLSQLRSFVNDQRTVGATYVRDWLLDVWSIAHRIDSRVAQPAETLLTRLVGRDMVTAEEIREACDDTEKAVTAGPSSSGVSRVGGDRT